MSLRRWDLKAKALLTAISRDPKHVFKALAA
jgi:hypothetical protein